MSQAFMIIPIKSGVGVTTVTLGLVRAMEEHGYRVGFFKPITTRSNIDNDLEQTTRIFRESSEFNPPEPIPLKHAEELLSNDKMDKLLEEIVAGYNQCSQPTDRIIIQGLITTQELPYASRLNIQIAKALDAQVIFVTSPGNDDEEKIQQQVEIAARPYGGIENSRVIGAIINKINGPVDDKGNTRLDLAIELPSASPSQCGVLKNKPSIFNKDFKLLACIPWNAQLIAPRVSDIVQFLHADVLFPGDMEQRRITHITLCARSVTHMIDALKPGTLIITAGDRSDVILATAMAASNGVKIAALLLTGDYTLEDNLVKLCRKAIKKGLPILNVPSDSFRTALKLQNLNMQVPVDDKERIEMVKDYAASFIGNDWLTELNNVSGDFEKRMSPPAFRYQLIEKARNANKRIVLPEGDEPRTIEAAIICTEREIAHCILLAKREEVELVAEQHGLSLPSTLEIIDPETIASKYVKQVVEIRKHKGATEELALKYLKNRIPLGTMMLQTGEVDGLVAGAVHTTADTIRPALKLIKTAPDSELVSSIFFMCLPDQVLIYGDCAVNTDPNEEQLADIAIQSYHSAVKFGITPRVAMISYSTGSSGTGFDVEKVRHATEIVRQKASEIVIDGPLQYDAAYIPSVAKTKAPNSPVAGKATVFIFPDLNTGNTTYKAVQRSAKVLCIGPMLQGLAKPVNDLSRGASVDDIVYTIAITAIQAT